MNNLLIGTTNKAKIKELTKSLEPLAKLDLKLLTLNDVQIEGEPVENGNTFRANAEIKARFYAQQTGLPTIGDDGGLTIDVLNGEPGVRSKRWLGRDATDEELIDYTLKRLSGKRTTDRTAQFCGCVCFYDPKKKILLCSERKTEGWVAEKPSGKGIPGFPYRSLLKITKFNKYYDEMTPEEHEQVNHRRMAVQDLIQQIKKHYSV